MHDRNTKKYSKNNQANILEVEVSLNMNEEQHGQQQFKILLIQKVQWIIVKLQYYRQHKD